MLNFCGESKSGLEIKEFPVDMPFPGEGVWLVNWLVIGGNDTLQKGCFVESWKRPKISYGNYHNKCDELSKSNTDEPRSGHHIPSHLVNTNILILIANVYC